MSEKMLMERGDWWGKVSYNYLMKPRPLDSEPGIIPDPTRANDDYRAIYTDGDYKFVTPQTMGDIACIERCAKWCKDLEGDIAEAGVYYGATARLILRFFGTKTIHLFDTFESMPEANPKYDIPERWHPQKNLSIDLTRKVLGDFYEKGLVVFHKGLFKDTLHEAKDSKFCFVHIDCDLYEGAKDATEFFYPRMVTDGVMLYHDYDSPSFPGIKRAVEEFFMFKPDLRITNRFGGHHVVVKKGVNA